MKNQLRNVLLLGAVLGLLGNTVHANSNPPPVDPNYTPPTEPDGGSAPATDSGSTDDTNTPPPPPPSGYGGTVWHDYNEPTSDWDC
jgi:hypothetical protein